MSWAPVQGSRLPTLLGLPSFDSSTLSVLYCVLELHLLFSSLLCIQVSVSQPRQRVRSNMLARTSGSRASRRPLNCASHSSICFRAFSLTARNADSRVSPELTSRDGVSPLLPALPPSVAWSSTPNPPVPMGDIASTLVTQCQDPDHGEVGDVDVVVNQSAEGWRHIAVREEHEKYDNG